MSKLLGNTMKTIYGLIKDSDRPYDALEIESTSQERTQWAKEIKAEAERTVGICKVHEDKNKVDIVSTNYKADIVIQQIVNELTTLTEYQGKIAAYADEIKREGAVK